MNFSKIKKKKLSGQVISVLDSQTIRVLSYRNGNLWGEDMQLYSDYTTIKSYVFWVDEVNATFIKNYDSASDKTTIEGVPLVQRIGTSSADGDSLLLNFLFVDRIFSKFDVQFSVNGGPYMHAPLTASYQDLPYPCFSYNESVAEQDHFSIHFLIHTEDKYNGGETGV